MAAHGNAAPAIIKKKKIVSGDGGHHGGAWKVAYADFVTAMMAFFMLMWLLNATTEKQRKGIADYFSPTIPINRISGGGDGAFGGETVFSEDDLPQNGTGAMLVAPTEARQSRGESGLAPQGAETRAHDESFKEVIEALMGRGGESMVTEELLKHIVTRVTDEGLVIEVFATEDSPLFAADAAAPTPLMRDLMGMIARVSRLVENDMAVAGHVPARPLVVARNPSWDLSTARAHGARTLLERAGVASERVRRVTGHADRQLVVDDPMAPRNDRIEVILLRD